MDPGTIIAVTELTGKTIKLAHTLVNDFRNALENLRHAQEKVSSMEKSLSKLQELLPAPEEKQPFSLQLDDYKSILESCQEEMRLLQGILSSISSGKRGKFEYMRKKRELEKRLAQIAAYDGAINSLLMKDMMTMVNHNTKSLRITGQNHFRDMLCWLSPVDPSQNYNAAIQKRQPGTGEWLLRSPAYRNWIDSPGSLWLEGIGGCGKTVLSSTVISDLQTVNRDEDALIVYFYFDFRDQDKQTSGACLRAVTAQVAEANNSQALGTAYQKHGNGRREISFIDAVDLLKQAKNHKELFIVLDALDECSDAQGLPTLLDILSESGTHLLVTTRADNALHASKSIFDQYLVMDQAGVTDDIAVYVSERVLQSDTLSDWPSEVQDQMREKLLAKAGCMFRWVQCELDEMELCTSSKDLFELLDTLPEGLYGTYDRILTSIPSKERVRASRILTSLAISLVDLTVAKIENILQADPMSPDFTTNDRLSRKAIVRLCRSMVVFEPTLSAETGDGYLRLAHLTVKEYLFSKHLQSSQLSSFYLTESLGHRVLAEICVCHLLTFDDETYPTRSDIDQRCPFMVYAAKYATSHASWANDEPSRGVLDELLAKLLDPRNRAYINWYRLSDPCHFRAQRKWNFVEQVQHRLGRTPDMKDLVSLKQLGTPLSVCALFNFWRVIEILLAKNPRCVIEEAELTNATGDDSAFHECLQTRAPGVNSLELLVSGGADVNQASPNGLLPLHICTYSTIEGRERVHFLLERNASLEIGTPDMGTALQCACYLNKIDIVETILGFVKDVDYAYPFNTTGSRGFKYHNALQVAAGFGSTAVVESLIQYGAKVNLVAGDLGTALHAAALHARLDNIDVLLQHEADPRVEAGVFKKVVVAGACSGDKPFLRGFFMTLRSRGFNELLTFDFEDESSVDEEVRRAQSNCQSVLGAINLGSVTRMEELLQPGVDVNKPFRKGAGVIHLLTHCSYKGRLELAELLIKYGADPDQENNVQFRPLHYAKSPDMVRLLLASGAKRDPLNAQGLRPVDRNYTYRKTEVADYLQSLIDDSSKKVEWRGCYYNWVPEERRYRKDELAVVPACDNSA
ncbi:MAG: hypothetical protein M1820_009295 [Bogoriella megaspora]|nr:MAG: hypothetical protein M1820_009295 [Bogoriella megaspora]